MAEQYSIGGVKGFQVVSIDGRYYSPVFPSLEEAQKHEKELLATPKIEVVHIELVKDELPKTPKKTITKSKK